MIELELKRELRKYKNGLRELQQSCFTFLRRLDEVMKEPESGLRGKKIAFLSNQLEMANDRVRHFILNMPISADKKDREWKRIRKVLSL